MHLIYLIHEFHNLSWIIEINEIFHDILIYWDAPVYILLSRLNLTAGLFTDSTLASHSEISENVISIMKEPMGSWGGAQSAGLAQINTGRLGREAERRVTARSDGRSIA